MRLFILIAALCLAVLAGSAPAATFYVNSDADAHDALPGDGVASDGISPDSSQCTLRAAIEEANALAGPDTILVPVEIGPIRLSLGSLYLQDNSTMIVGTGGRPIIDAVANPINQNTFIIESDSNTVQSLLVRRSRGDGFEIFGSANRIGVQNAGLIFIANGLDNSLSCAIRITGPEAVGNTVEGNYIGLAANGMTVEGNANGIAIEHGARLNWIGGLSTGARNIISGNVGYGVVVSAGTSDNRIAGNFIGLDSTGNSGPGNQRDGIAVLGDANNNFIGGDSLPEGNIISGNWGNGITLAGSGVANNRVDGNLIGTNQAGYEAVGNLSDGIYIADGAHDNQIGGTQLESGNLISGNAASGVHLSGPTVMYNLLTANWIGLSRAGYGYVSNGWLTNGDGVTIDGGANYNIVGGTTSALRNIISANYRFGVGIQGEGTKDNLVIGNYIGLSYAGTSSLGNSVGVCISDGAKSNTIGGLTAEYRNVISGNGSDTFPYDCGVLLIGAGTDFNRVMANIIGLDATGVRARQNGSSGVIIGDGAQYNVIGGADITDGNIISGNGIHDPIEGHAGGIHMYGVSTAHNRISGNLIGPNLGNQTIVGNRGHGIGVYSGAHNNIIGGESIRECNLIVGNEGAGVYITGSETRNNLIRRNSMYNNDGLGIDLRDSAQNGITPPEITQVGILYTYSPRYVEGRNALPGSRIDFYDVGQPDPSGSGEGYTYLGNTTADALGFYEVFLPSGPPIPIVLTAVATDADSNSSAFSVNAYSPDATPVDDPGALLPAEFSVSQNYPNPFNGGTMISFSLSRREYVSLSIYNVLGQKVRSLADRLYFPGSYDVTWDGRDETGIETASGVYFYRLDCEEGTVTRKMLMLK